MDLPLSLKRSSDSSRIGHSLVGSRASHAVTNLARVHETFPFLSDIRRSSPFRQEHPTLDEEGRILLAAARIWAGSSVPAELVTFDERLALAARLEGFRVLPGSSGSAPNS